MARLKRLILLLSISSASAFPQIVICGPIEAYNNPCFKSIEMCFHRSLSVARLKQNSSGRTCLKICVRFHRSLSVARLKHDGDIVKSIDIEYGFHRSLSVARLKQDEISYSEQRPARFPQIVICGPIEALCRISYLIFERCVSTDRYLWPD